MQSNNKGDSLTDNLWAEMSLMMVLVVIVLALHGDTSGNSHPHFLPSGFVSAESSAMLGDKPRPHGCRAPGSHSCLCLTRRDRSGKRALPPIPPYLPPNRRTVQTGH
jgi:hypothetical protein